MALTRQQKEERMTHLQQDLSQAQSIVFVQYDGLTVTQANELRNQLYADKTKMRVMPKRLLRIVMQQLKLDFDPTKQTGQVAVIWGEDTVTPAKAVATFTRKHDNMQIAGGVLEGIIMSAVQVIALATLPSKKELIGIFVGTLAGPLRQFQSVLVGSHRQLIYALSALQEQKLQKQKATS